MRKIINGLRYGNSKTKAYIIVTFLLILAGTLCLCLFAVTKAPLWALGMTFSYLMAFIITQSLSFKKMGEVTPKTSIDQKNKAVKASISSLQGHDDNSVLEEADGQDYLKDYDDEKIKSVLIKYKAKKDHRPIMIDSCPSKNIYQCPAYAWMEKNDLVLLLFEKEPRRVTISLQGITSLTYERGAAANPQRDYASLTKTSFMSLVFAGYLPTVSEESYGLRSLYKKNLYVLGKDLKVTNTSAKTIMDLTLLDLSVENIVRDRNYQNVYFCTAYAQNILLKDTVISVTEFKHKIKKLLQTIADSNISYEDFLNYMNQMVTGHVVTKEYAEYYIDYKNRKNK